MDQVTTLPNILKEFRPDLVGFSTELSDPMDNSLNVGVVGAKSVNITAQVDLLIERISNNPDIDFENDWKLVTVLIGYNDICDFSCLGNAFDLVEDWIRNIDRSLTTLSHSLPRTFVNLILLGLPSVALRYVALSPGPFCSFIYQRYCPCILQAANSSMPDRVAEHFNERLIELVESRRYDKTNEFTVVVQPASPLTYENATFDQSYVSFDCLHMSASGNRLSATHLWNNMLRPVGSKDSGPASGTLPNCAANDIPYLYTYLNSAGKYSLLISGN